MFVLLTEPGVTAGQGISEFTRLLPTYSTATHPEPGTALHTPSNINLWLSYFS